MCAQKNAATRLAEHHSRSRTTNMRTATNDQAKITDPGELPLYDRVIVEEAKRRGITVEAVDAKTRLFAYTLAGQRILVRDALSERTSAVAFCICDDKGLTRRILAGAGLRVPGQQLSTGGDEDRQFLQRHGHIVVKPVRGEQGRGVAVDITTEDDMRTAIEAARREDSQVLLEEFVAGDDLRVLVIDDEVVAGAVRRHPAVTGNGRDTVEALIRARSREREQQTDGESHIPMDAETERCVRAAGWRMDQVLPEGEEVVVRKTNNVHTGGTIHDVTDDLHPSIREVALKTARAIGIPVVGVDFLMPDVRGEEYVIIEANENPGLANHEPQPTVQRFVDFLFPESRGR